MKNLVARFPDEDLSLNRLSSIAVLPVDGAARSEKGNSYQ